MIMKAQERLAYPAAGVTWDGLSNAPWDLFMVRPITRAHRCHLLCGKENKCEKFGDENPKSTDAPFFSPMEFPLYFRH